MQFSQPLTHNLPFASAAWSTNLSCPVLVQITSCTCDLALQTFKISKYKKVFLQKQGKMMEHEVHFWSKIFGSSPGVDRKIGVSCIEKDAFLKLSGWQISHKNGNVGLVPNYKICSLNHSEERTQKSGSKHWLRQKLAGGLENKHAKKRESKNHCSHGTSACLWGLCSWAVGLVRDKTDTAMWMGRIESRFFIVI